MQHGRIITKIWLALPKMFIRFRYKPSKSIGRNRWLPVWKNGGRGLTEKRLRALTVIHNYGLKRADGTTAAMRLFGRDFPDLFSWLVDEMGALPLPRKGRERVTRNPLFLKTVPA